MNGSVSAVDTRFSICCMPDSLRKVLHDIGLLEAEEPFEKSVDPGHGAQRRCEDVEVCRKHRQPGAEIIEKYGCVRDYFILFAAPPEQRDLDWSDTGVEGSYSSQQSIGSSGMHRKDAGRAEVRIESKDDKSLYYELNKTVKVTDSFCSGPFQFQHRDQRDHGAGK